MNQEDKLIRLTQNHPIKPFDCGDQSLNKFLFKEAKLSQTKLLSITYLLENETDTIAFFSLSNDKIGINEFGGTNLQKLRKKLGKRLATISTYSASLLTQTIFRPQQLGRFFY